MVSPIRRALHTAFLVFQNHPNFNQLTFKVDPDLREVFTCVCDVPDSVTKTIDDFKQVIPNLDTSLLDSLPGDRDLWFLNNLDPDVVANIKKDMDQAAGNQ